jgi:hypothetical protein
MRGEDERSGSLFRRSSASLHCADGEPERPFGRRLGDLKPTGVRNGSRRCTGSSPRADRPQAIPLGADKADDAEDFVNELRSMNATPHVAQNANGRSSTINGRTTCHAGYAISQRIRKTDRGSLRLDEDDRRAGEDQVSEAAIASVGPSPSRRRPPISRGCPSSWRKPHERVGQRQARRPLADRRGRHLGPRLPRSLSARDHDRLIRTATTNVPPSICSVMLVQSLELPARLLGTTFLLRGRPRSSQYKGFDGYRLGALSGPRGEAGRTAGRSAWPGTRLHCSAERGRESHFNPIVKVISTRSYMRGLPAIASREIPQARSARH